MLVIVTFTKSTGHTEKFHKLEHTDKPFVNYRFISLSTQLAYSGRRKLRCIVFLHLYYNNMGCPELTDSFALFVAVVELASVAFCQSDQVAARAPARWRHIPSWWSNRTLNESTNTTGVIWCPWWSMVVLARALRQCLVPSVWILLSDFHSQ